MWPAVQVADLRCDALGQADPQALGLTYWFDAAPVGEPYPITIRFAGRRPGPGGPSIGLDRFTASETISTVVPGSGRVAVTTRIFDVAPGDWRVTAGPISLRNPRQAGSPGSTTSSADRPASGTVASACGRTAFAPIVQARAPGVRLGAWPVMVGVGVASGLAVQGLLSQRTGLPVLPVLLLSLAACLIGLLGSKLYYLAEQRILPTPRALLGAGMCIQGFVAGTLVTAAIGAQTAGISVARFLDVTAPGLLFGMAIGRLGCFFGGCCAGRPTASRWGVWSSDRRVGMRRIPAQLLESGLSLGLAWAALTAVLSGAVRPPGALVGSVAVYTLGRQALLPLRDIPRHTTYGRRVALTLSPLVLLGVVLLALVA